MLKTLPLIVLLALLVVPAAHAVEPSATPRNAAQWCTAWKKGAQTEKLNLLFPGNAGYVATFATKTRERARQEEPLRPMCVVDG